GTREAGGDVGSNLAVPTVSDGHPRGSAVDAIQVVQRWLPVRSLLPPTGAVSPYSAQSSPRGTVRRASGFALGRDGPDGPLPAAPPLPPQGVVRSEAHAVRSLHTTLPVRR